ncbi:MAG: DUF3422 domain-containing protein [Pseudomonadota bacterium]
MLTTIPDHPLRYELANELHARPFPSLGAPSSVMFLAIKRLDGANLRDPEADARHLTELLDRFGAPHPNAGASHYTGELGRYRLKWESHTELVTYTAYRDGIGERPFDPADFEIFPEDWLAQAPGHRLTSAHIRVDTMKPEEEIANDIVDLFVAESVAVARVLDDTAIIAGDYRIDPAGHLRFLVHAADNVGQRRLGRIVARLCEIESYKSLSMLGFARARDMMSRINELDDQLSHLVGNMPGGGVPPETTLDDLLNISAELESMVAKSSHRFGATGAYEQIVKERINVLREERFQGRQTFGEFMLRRYDPAMRTVRATQTRLDSMATRTMRAGELLRTRVDVERSAQNQALLESMNRRADMQLRLQRTVEGLSVVAISYYAVSLVAFLLYPLSDRTGLSVQMLTALSTVPVFLIVWWIVRRIRQHIS